MESGIDCSFTGRSLCADLSLYADGKKYSVIRAVSLRLGYLVHSGPILLMVGFPMSEMAFGNLGINLAAVYNAYFMLVFIPCAFLLIGIYGGGSEELSFGRRILSIIRNPILLAAVFGTVVAYSGEFFKVEQIAENGAVTREIIFPGMLSGVLRIIEAFLRLVGSMGLPMALVAIGGGDEFESDNG